MGIEAIECQPIVDADLSLRGGDGRFAIMCDSEWFGIGTEGNPRSRMPNKIRMKRPIFSELEIGIFRLNRWRTEIDQEMECGSAPHVERDWTLQLEHDSLGVELLSRQRPLVNCDLHLLKLPFKAALAAVAVVAFGAGPINGELMISVSSHLLKLGMPSIRRLEFSNLCMNLALGCFLDSSLEALKM